MARLFSKSQILNTKRLFKAHRTGFPVGLLLNKHKLVLCGYIHLHKHFEIISNI